jgi:hypothetical protein
VQERRHELELHPFAERQLADRLEHELPHAEHVDELVARPLEAGGVEPVDLLVEAEALGGGQVPPQLVPLAHDEREPAPKIVGPLPGHMAEHPGRAAGGRDDPGEQLEEGRLAGAVGAEQGHELAAVHGEVHAAQGLDHAARAVEQAPHARP